MICPSEVTARRLNPTSMPVSRPQAGSGVVSRSTTNEAKYRPSGSRITVTLDGSLGRLRDQRTLISPTFAAYNRGPRRENPLRVSRIDCRPCLRRGLGCPILRPFRLLDNESNQFR